jgi:hypothetical protein
MKQARHLGLSALPLVTSLLLMVGMVECTSAPAAPPPSSTELPADTAAPAPAEDATLWEVVLQTEVEQPTRMAAFLDDKVGFTGGEADPGKAHYTTDGGATWTLAETSTG